MLSLVGILDSLQYRRSEGWGVGDGTRVQFQVSRRQDDDWRVKDRSGDRAGRMQQLESDVEVGRALCVVCLCLFCTAIQHCWGLYYSITRLHSHWHVTMKIPTKIVDDARQQSNHLLAKPMPLQVLDCCCRPDALLDVPSNRLLQKGHSACETVRQAPWMCLHNYTLTSHPLLYRSVQHLHISVRAGGNSCSSQTLSCGS